MNYKLYQIHLTDAEVDQVNAEGHNSVPKQKLKLDMSFNDNVAELAKEAMDKGYYTHVSNIEAEGLEGVFEVGNIGPEQHREAGSYVLCKCCGRSRDSRGCASRCSECRLSATGIDS
tara:strand:+ start:587 stop:937 length:351 start_codon:yes stop_codon:yes gene_type:complete